VSLKIVSTCVFNSKKPWWCGWLGGLINTNREAIEITHCWIKLEIVVLHEFRMAK
jgi:hypothetical protein